MPPPDLQPPAWRSPPPARARLATGLVCHRFGAPATALARCLLHEARQCWGLGRCGIGSSIELISLAWVICETVAHLMATLRRPDDCVAGTQLWARSGRYASGGGMKRAQCKSRIFPSHSWEMRLKREIWVPLYSWNLSRGLAGVGFFVLDPEFLSTCLSRSIVGVALTN